MIAAFARFDLASWLPRRQSLLPLAFVAVIGVLLPIPGMAIATTALVTSLMIAAPFLADEKGRLDTLYGTLPISRTAVAIGRTLAILAYYLLAALIATAVTFVVAAVRGDMPSPEILLIAHAASFAVVGLAMSLQLPVFFRIGYSRGRLMSYTPALVIAGALWVAQATGLSDPIGDGSLDIPVPVIAGLGFLVGGLGIVAAATISVRTYRRRAI